MAVLGKNPCHIPISAVFARFSGLFPLLTHSLRIPWVKREKINHTVPLLSIFSRVVQVLGPREVLQPSQYVSGVREAGLPSHIPRAMSVSAGT